MISPIVYADLRRIIRKIRCDGMSEADILYEIAEMLKFGLYGDAKEDDF